jgi:hypothetical protein
MKGSRDVEEAIHFLTFLLTTFSLSPEVNNDYTGM